MTDTHHNSSHHVLSLDQLYKNCDLSGLKFNNTNELPELQEIIGQKRALAAIDFGMGMDHKGYNLFILGSEGIGKTALIKKLLKQYYVNRKKPFEGRQIVGLETKDRLKLDEKDSWYVMIDKLERR